DHSLETPALCSPLIEILEYDRPIEAQTCVVARLRFVQLHEALRIREGQRPKQDPAHNAENCGVGANPEGERGHSGDGQDWSLHPNTQRKLQILKDVFNQLHRAQTIVLNPIVKQSWTRRSRLR